MNRKEYESLVDEKLASVKEELMQEFKEESESEYPEYGTIYCYIGNNGCVYQDKWEDYSTDMERFAFGNYFKTEKEAKFEAKRLKVIAELKRFAESENRAWDGVNKHWYFYYDTKINEFRIIYVFRDKVSTLYFESLDKAKEAVKTVGKDKVIKYYLEA